MTDIGSGIGRAIGGLADGIGQAVSSLVDSLGALLGNTVRSVLETGPLALGLIGLVLLGGLALILRR